jgi:hypothetical protein
MDDSVGRDGRAEGDPVRRVVHAALAVYLLPALLIVLAVGGLFLAVASVARGAASTSRWLSGVKRGVSSAATTRVPPGWVGGLEVRTHAPAGYPRAGRLR